MANKKRFIYKVYSVDASLWDVMIWDQDNWDYEINFSTTWDDDVVSEPYFNSQINGGVGSMMVKLARPFTNFGEGIDVRLGNQVDLYVYDKEVPNGQLLYRGFINSYSTVLNEEQQYIEVELWGYYSRLQQFMLEDTDGNTALTYNSSEPSAIIRDVIEKYKLGGGLGIDYNASSINDTGTVVSYTFNLNTIQDCLSKIIELCPDNWYYYVTPQGLLRLGETNIANATHKFAIGREIKSLRVTKNLDEVVNSVYFLGGTPTSGIQIYKKTESSGSIDTYGKRAKKEIDERVTVNSTATILSNRILSNQSEPKTIVELTIIDSNGSDDGLGYDIESINPGDSIQILNINFEGSTTSLWDVMVWDVDVWDYTIQQSAAEVLEVLEVSYSPTEVTIKAGLQAPEVSKRIEDIKRNLDNLHTYDAPTNPET